MKPPLAISDAEIRLAARLLEENPRGLNKQAREQHFGSDRRGRQVISEVVCRGMARVVNVVDPVLGHVQRLARSDAEVEAEQRVIRSRITELERRLNGLELAPESGVRTPQRALF